ncbi:MAG TPA: metalloregulator ArsR/SmtB family transcription factor, partial [Thermomicrobiales bacterium]|nr:metalloregulator ArsR/SmtB family transcription factor [Thermomicrobiales bacterium]
MNDDQIDRLARLFRAIADPARLRILGELAAAPRTGHELADRLRLTPPTISHHMAKLVDVGLVRVEPEAQRRHYSLDTAALRALAAPNPSVTEPSESDAAGERDRVLRAFFDGERLRSIPAQRKKRVMVLQRLLERFAPGRDYPEREVNDLLRLAHDDVATLRRELVDYGFLV